MAIAVKPALPSAPAAPGADARFEGLVLAAGPFSFITESKVSGVFDYDYELGNWLTDQNGLQFTYSVGANVIFDRVTGSIRYVEEPGAAPAKVSQTRLLSLSPRGEVQWQIPLAFGEGMALYSIAPAADARPGLAVMSTEDGALTAYELAKPAR